MKKKYTALFDPTLVTKLVHEQLLRDYDEIIPKDPRSYNFDRKYQSDNGLKKLITKKGSYLRSTAFNTFFDAQEHLGSVSSLDSIDRNINRYRHLDLRNGITNSELGIDYTLLLARNIFQEIVGDINWESFFPYCRHSSGVSIGVNFQDTSPSAKMTIPLSSSIEGARLFMIYLDWDPQLKEVIADQFPDLHLFNAMHLPPIFNFINASKATTVPKNDKTDRMIATEPTVDMFLQQGVMRYLFERLVTYGYDMRDRQEVHKLFALIASVTGTSATIDWKSASDCVLRDLVFFFCTTPQWHIMAPICRKWIKIGKQNFPTLCMSTMGNAITFPLETIVFLSIALACNNVKTTRWCTGTFDLSEVYRGGRIASINYNPDVISVFGDDCIIPTAIATDFLSVCERVGFICNQEKSFTEGSFRESCGGDYFSFRNVRPVFLTGCIDIRRKSLIAWIYTLWNKVLKKQISLFGTLNYVYASRTLEMIASIIVKNVHFVNVVPDDFPDDSGIKMVNDVRLLFLFKGAKFSPFRRCKHGILSFSFLSYVPEYMELEHFEMLSYWHNLKNPNGDFGEVHKLERVNRDQGRYVVATGETSGAFSAWVAETKYLCSHIK